MRGIALGRRNWTFAGSQRGADRAAVHVRVELVAVRAAAEPEQPCRFDLGVITNCDDDLFAASNRKLGVEFDYVITAQQVGAYKPSPRGFEVAFETPQWCWISSWLKSCEFGPVLVQSLLLVLP